MANYERILVIMNPVSGQQDPDEVTRLIESARPPQGVHAEVRRTEGAGDAEAWARGAAEEGFRHRPYLRRRRHRRRGDVGAYPHRQQDSARAAALGTASQIALALSISRDLDEALELLFDAPSKVVDLDVGYLPRDDRYFALITGAGFDAQVIESSPRELKRRLGFMAYVLVGLRESLRVKRSTVTLTLDGKERRVRAHTAMIVNIGRIDNANISIGPISGTTTVS
jgi:diacylglycerol kinase family enzyme